MKCQWIEVPEYYFAYGSNMSPQRMKERCPSAVPRSKGVLHGYTLKFNVWSPHYDDGLIAGLCESEGDVIEGMLYEILDEGDSRELDRFEAETGYGRRHGLTVETEEGATSAYTYQTDKPRISKRYLRDLLEGAEANNLHKVIELVTRIDPGP